MSNKNLKQLGIDDPNKGILVIVLCSKWCKSCKFLSPILQKFRDDGIIKLKEIDIGENSKFALEFNINAVPALIFFKDGELLNKNYKVNGETLVNNGIMIGSFNELILKQIIEQI